MADRTLFLGIDGGGSTCRARIADENGMVLGEGRGGPSNTTLGIARIYAEIVVATDNALKDAGLPAATKGQLHAGFGLAGLHLGRDRDDLMAADHPFASVTINTDAYTACLGAHQGRDGGIVIFGTGSCGFVIVNGAGINVGGWGFRLSDHGCGAHVGLEAIRRALQAHDDILPQSEFTQAVMQHFDQQPDKAVIWSETAKPTDYGKFAPLVVEFAGKHDPLATRIMWDAAKEAGHLIEAVHRKGAERISLLGGFSKYLVDWLPGEVTPLLVAPQGDAMDGAIRMAMQQKVGEGSHA